MKLAVRVIPNAPRTEITGMRGDEIVLRVNAPASDGRANAAAARYLALRLGVPASRIRLSSGAKSRHKKFEVLGVEDSSGTVVSLLSEHD